MFRSISRNKRIIHNTQATKVTLPPLSQQTKEWPSMAKHGQATETKSAINLTRRGHQVRSITKEKEINWQHITSTLTTTKKEINQLATYNKDRYTSQKKLYLRDTCRRKIFLFGRQQVFQMQTLNLLVKRKTRDV